MSDKIIQTRIQMKIDTEIKWQEIENDFIPLLGEFIIYNTDDTHDKVRMKVGDGQNTLINLPWATDLSGVEQKIESLKNELNEKIENTKEIWYGTKAEYDTANAADEIKAGTVVILTDDNNIAAGGSGENAGGTSAKLGTAVLGTMILGQE